MTEIRTTSETGGQKGMKPERFDLIPAGALAHLARQYGFGAEKYSDNNWRAGYEWSKAYAALQRHALAFWGGEDMDEESGQPHMAAVAWHAFTLLTFMEEHPMFDDRYKKPGKRAANAVERASDSGLMPSDEALAALREKLTSPATDEEPKVSAAEYKRRVNMETVDTSKPLPIHNYS